MISRRSIGSCWPTRTLSDVVDFLDHRRKPITKKYRVSGPYPYYGANGQQDSVADYIFDEPLILLAEDGGHFGDPEKTIAYRVSGKCWVNNHAHVLRPRSSVDIGFLCRQLEQYDVRPFVTGTTRGKLTKSACARIPLAVPPIEEQRRIAAILDKADVIRRKRLETIELTDQLLRSTFLEMFGDPVTNPKGWPISTIGALGAKTQYGTSSRANTEGRGFPIIRMGNLTYEGGIDLAKLKHVELASDDLEKYTVRRGDLLFNRTNSPELVGKTAVWDVDERYALAGYIVRVRFDRALAHPAYVSAYLNSEYGKRLLFHRAKPSSNMSNLSASEFRRLPIGKPPVELQRRFAAFVAAVRKTRVRMDAAEVVADELFGCLQQRAFRGEL